MCLCGRIEYVCIIYMKTKDISICFMYMKKMFAWNAVKHCNYENIQSKIKANKYKLSS